MVRTLARMTAMHLDATPTRSDAAERLQERLAQGRESSSYQTYREVLARVLRMKDEEARSGETGRPSAYWREELESFDYMLDASPLIIEKLRQHCHHLTGIRTYDYRSEKKEAKRALSRKLDALIATGDRRLLVPEARALGGFGFEIDGELYNVDTLKFFEAFIALQRAEVLAEFRNPALRRVVWEIGSGWGGFAYQFKTLFPDTTYILMDLPELFLYSGVYLSTLFPHARIAFYGDRPLPELLGDAASYDFILLPHTSLGGFSLPRLDLTVNMVSFQEMTTAQVEAYAAKAAQQGSRYLYSLNRDRGPYNTELTSVRSVLSRHFWPQDIEVLPIPYTKMIDDRGLPAKAGRKRPHELDYRHVVGWKRIGDHGR